ncbi:MAG: PspA/IM30 family protein [Candidatus Schekmanbacteria bacterium]|nr:PspA/IM30 family protein [Candidatus Schekmanbacteria bacterium]
MFSRIARLFKSIVNAILGRAESQLTIPQMELAHREMQQNLFKYKQAVAGAIAYEKRAQRKLEEERQRYDALTEKAKVAVQQSLQVTDAGRKAELEQLAKRALQLRKQAEDALKTMESAHGQAAAQSDAAKKRFNVAADEVEKRARQLQQARTIADLNKSRAEVTKMAGSLDINSSAGIFDEGLERVLSSSDRLDAMDNLALSEGQELDQKLAELTGESGVQNDFDAMVAELGGAPATKSRQSEFAELDTALES